MVGTIVVTIAASGPAGLRVTSSRLRDSAAHQASSRLREVEVMEAQVGDRLVILSRHLDEHLRSGEIVEVHGAHGAPPYVVRWADEERTALVFPCPDAHVEPAKGVTAT